MRLVRILVGIVLAILGVNGILRAELVGNTLFAYALAASLICGGSYIALRALRPERTMTALRLLVGLSLLALSATVLMGYTAAIGWPGVLAWMITLSGSALGIYFIVPFSPDPTMEKPQFPKHVRCPACGFEEWRLAAQVHSEGTVEISGEATSGLSDNVNVTVEGRAQTTVAAQAAPPILLPIAKPIAAMALLAVFMALMDVERPKDAEFFLWSSYGFLAFFLYVVLAVLYNNTWRRPKLRAWLSTAMCSRCGQLYRLDAAGSGSNDVS